MGHVRITPLDGKIPNLALMHLAAWHKSRGDTVHFRPSIERTFDEPEYAHVYASAIFSTTQKKIALFKQHFPNAIIGGTGSGNPVTVEDIVGGDFEEYDYLDYVERVTKRKKDPATGKSEKIVVEQPWSSSIGFTQRGCRLKCGFCLTPDTQIITADGLKAIIDVKVGDLVLTHLGRYRRVTNTMSRPYSGEVRQLKANAVSDLFPTTVTVEHPIYMRRITYASGGQYLSGFKWVEAGQIEPGNIKRSRDVYAYPRTIQNEMQEGDPCPGAPWLKISPDLMTVFGWYLAEGYLTNEEGRGWYRTTFCLGHSDKEVSYAETLKTAAEACGLHMGIRTPSIGIRCVVDNVKLARWILDQFGRGSQDKRIPLWVRLLPPDLLRPLLKAWNDGDGWDHIKKGTQTWKTTTVSPNLAVSLREMALKCGYAATINEHKPGDVIQGRKVTVQRSHTVIYREQRAWKRSVSADESYVYSGIKQSESSHYEGLVYDIEVDGDHSFCTPSLILHNCVVPKKEGKNRSVHTIADIWRGPGFPKNILLLDNDFFGQELWRERVAEIREGGYKVCFSQGINTRKVDDEVAEALASIEYRDGRFKERRIYTAWDNIGDEAVFFKGVDTLERHGIKANDLMAYMLIGYDKRETWERIRYRFDRMVERGIEPFIMVFDPKDVRRKKFQRYVNMGLYRLFPFEEYDAGHKTKNQMPGQMSLFDTAGPGFLQTDGDASWTMADDDALSAMAAATGPGDNAVPAMAEKLGRSRAAVVDRLLMLGLRDEDGPEEVAA